MGKFRFTANQLKAGVKLSTGEPHRIIVGGVVRVRLVGLFFDTDKCFLLPSAMHGIRELKTQYDKRPKSNLLVVGHTDTQGTEQHNLDLSFGRASTMSAYLKDEVSAWEAFFAVAPPSGVGWGLLEVQHMLSALPDGKPPFYASEPNGLDDAVSRAAVERYQRAEGLTVDGIAGPITRKALIKSYMALDATSLPSSATLTPHGVGEGFPAQRTPNEVAAPDNRRVEVFFFDGPIVPPPPGKTQPATGTAYPEWRRQVSKTIDLTLGRASSTAELESRYALQRLEKVARELNEPEFVGWASMVYGVDIPKSAFSSLYRDLRAGTLVPPEIQLVPGGVDGAIGAYDNATQMIGVREESALAAEFDPDAADDVLLVLLHEFGHHVDHLLRTQYSQVGGDAPGEEATTFSYALLGLEHVDVGLVEFATLRRGATGVVLSVEFADFHAAVVDYLNDPAARDDAKRNTVEFFGAGRGNPAFPQSSFAHRSIEDGLGDADGAFFTAARRDEIYFGNWLRDMSQANDVGLLKYFKVGPIDVVAPFREVITSVLDLGAHKDFNPSLKPSQHPSGPFHVTTAKLGVYRAEEHIDNPEGMIDGRSIEPALRGPVLPPEVALDPNTGIKAYIATRGGGFVTSADFVDRSLRAAVAAGPTREGHRLFGQSLHTLEDLYAHSNFLELCLIRMGHAAVFPWVGAASRINVIRNGAPVSRIPMVTGVFGWVDTKVSIVSALGESLQKPIECEAGTFAPTSVALIKFFQALNSKGGDAVESLFALKHEFEANHPKIATAMCRATELPKEWIRAKIGTDLREDIKAQHKFQEAFFSNPASTAPTHSQLAKDHDDHPLHAVAAQCAKLMVRDVGLAMRDAWQGTLTPDALSTRALRYFIHPDDIDVRVAPGPGQLLGQVQAFADTNPAVIKSLDLDSSRKRFLEHAALEESRGLEQARVMYASNEALADRIAELSALA